jgi:hypothetical protein
MFAHSDKARSSVSNHFNLSNRNSWDNSLPKNNNSFGSIQPKLTINTPNDIYEKEADDMADKVMCMPIPEPINFSTSANFISRTCADCEKEEKELQRKESNSKTASVAPPIVQDALNSSGKSLDTDARSFMEPRFNYDFSNVKIHDDELAAKSASSINALAYTSGNDIVFSSGKYDTKSVPGKKLLAHELTHVVQQSDSLQTKNIQRWDWGRAGVGSLIGLGTGAAIGAGIGALVGGGIGALVGLGIGALVGGIVGGLIGGLTGTPAPPAPVSSLPAMSPWQLSQVPESTFTQQSSDPRLQDYRRAWQLLRAVFNSLNVNTDIDGSSTVPPGRAPNTREMEVINRNFSQILDQPNVRANVSGTGGRGIPSQAGSSTPGMQGRVRILTNNTDYGIKRYQLEMQVLGLSGQNSAGMDEGVRSLWTQFGINPAANAVITEQERKVAVFFMATSETANPGFYHPMDDLIYIRPGVNLLSPEGSAVVRHETVHFLGGRNRTLQAFRTKFGDAFLPYWSTFEEGIAELITEESTPAGEAPAPEGSRTIRNGSTEVTIESTGVYREQVRIMRLIMGDGRVGRPLLMQAYFTGVIPDVIFDLLRQNVRP